MGFLGALSKSSTPLTCRFSQIGLCLSSSLFQAKTFHLAMFEAREERYIKRKATNDSENRMGHRISIHDRPKIVDEKSRIGELGSRYFARQGHYTAIAILVERKTKLTKLVRVFGKNAKDLADKVIAVMLPLKTQIRTLTFDTATNLPPTKGLRKHWNARPTFLPIHTVLSNEG